MYTHTQMYVDDIRIRFLFACSFKYASINIKYHSAVVMCVENMFVLKVFGDLRSRGRLSPHTHTHTHTHVIAHVTRAETHTRHA